MLLLLDSLLQETMKVAILIISSLAATLAGPQYFPKRETSVEGRQFSEDPIINYAGWGFIAGLADYFIRDFLDGDTTTTTTVAPTTAVAEETTTTVATTTVRFRKKLDKKEKNQRKERKQKKAERKAAKLAAKRKAEEETKKAEQIVDDNMSEEQVDETAGATEEV